jgi:hypothetical protein
MIISIPSTLRTYNATRSQAVLVIMDAISFRSNNASDPTTKMLVVHISCSGSTLTAEEQMNRNTIQKVMRR